MSNTYSQAGLAVTKSFEGCVLTAYRDLVGVLTIGYGHTGPDVKPGMVINAAQATDLLKKDLEKFVTAANKLIKVEVTQGQFDACVDLMFNIGEGAFGKSTLLKKLNAGDYVGAHDEFVKWCYAGGKVVPGLLRRRQAEQKMFFS